MTLSVCLIVKNEEKVIARCLDCVSQFADEIVVVDTGSVDNTISIARGFTDKVYEYKWCDDFSKARNFSFLQATSDYIMWIDSDDIVMEEDIQKIKRLKKHLVADCYTMLYHVGYDSRGVPNFTFYRERIIRRGSGVWRGFVHEYIEVKGNVFHTDIAIYHKKITSSGRRNLNIYRAHLKEGLSVRDTYYYARELYYNGYYSSCIKNMKKFLKFATGGELVDGTVILSDCYLKRGDTGVALRWLFKLLEREEPKGEVCCKIGEIMKKMGKLDCAVFWYKSALLLTDEVRKGGFIRREFTGIVPALELTSILYTLGKIEEAREYHNLSKLIEPTHESVKFNERFFKN